ncbi:MAG: META domain-containing protein [Burkholderiaceae bacterium]|jgi:heat shock protein HslJ|nr:META domain-containing protein [Burkholderiaceae bacterium]
MDRRSLLCALPAGAVALGALMACAQTPPAASPLVGPQWQLVDLPGHALPAAGARPTLLLAGEPVRAMGTTGVNNFAGTAQMAGGTALLFGPLATTRRAGSPAAMQLESAYLAALAAARSYRTGAGTLDLLDAQGSTVARFSSGSPDAR